MTDKRHLIPEKIRNICWEYCAEHGFRQIAASNEVSRNVVKQIAARFGVLMNDPTCNPDSLGQKEFLQKLSQMNDDALDQAFYPSGMALSARRSDTVIDGKYYPDFKLLAGTVIEKRITQLDVYRSYMDECRRLNAEGLSRGYFCKLLSDEITAINEENKETKYYFIQDFAYGERVQIDFTGDTYYINTYHGPILVYAMVFSFPASYYTWAIFIRSQDTQTVCDAIRRFIIDLGRRMPQIMVCDNFKAAIISHKGTSIRYNQSFQSFMRRLGMAIDAAPVRHPQAKSCVEFSVKLIERLLKARKYELDTLKDFHDHCQWLQDSINEAINLAPFRKNTERTRDYLFRTYELPKLVPVKDIPSYMEYVSIASVPSSYHVLVNRHLYSVPYKYVNHPVTVELSSFSVIIYYRGEEIARHERHDGPPIEGLKPDRSTIPEHMPEVHRKIVSDKQRFSSKEAVLDQARALDGPDGGLYLFCSERLRYAERDPSQYMANAISSCAAIIRMYEKSPYRYLVSKACAHVIRKENFADWMKSTVEQRYRMLLDESCRAGARTRGKAQINYASHDEGLFRNRVPGEDMAPKA